MQTRITTKLMAIYIYLLYQNIKVYRLLFYVLKRMQHVIYVFKYLYLFRGCLFIYSIN